MVSLAEYQALQESRCSPFSIETTQRVFSQTAEVEIKNLPSSRIKCHMTTIVWDLLAVNVR